MPKHVFDLPDERVLPQVPEPAEVFFYLPEGPPDDPVFSGNPPHTALEEKKDQKEDDGYGEKGMEKKFAMMKTGTIFLRGLARFSKKPIPDVMHGLCFQRTKVQARSLLWWYANGELGISQAELSARLRITPASVSMAVQRGRQIAEKNGYTIEKILNSGDYLLKVEKDLLVASSMTLPPRIFKEGRRPKGWYPDPKGKWAVGFS